MPSTRTLYLFRLKAAHIKGWLSEGREEATVAVVISILYAWYLLLLSDYHNLYYDAEHYWQLGHRFYQGGHFSLLAYDDALRGYTYPLVNFACLGLRMLFKWEVVTVVKLANSVLAGALFGVVGPRLWQVTTGGKALPSIGRRLLWAALSFVFWRDYFNFSLSDFPALFAFGLAIWQAQRSNYKAAFIAGLAMAMAVNIRPIYLVAVPPGLLLLLGSMRTDYKARLLLFCLGAALVLMPQWLINRRHFGANTPLVLSQSRKLHINNLYLEKLKGGLLREKCEAVVGPGRPTGELLFLDASGAAMLKKEGVAGFHSYSQYLSVVVRHPGVVLGSYARHLFAGLDISHPTPYLRQWQRSSLRNWFNYTLWFWAALVALGWQRPSQNQILVLASIALPCIVVLPMSMEVRYLLPLHLLLLSVVAFGPWPSWAVANSRRLVIVGLAYGLFVTGCFTMSASILQKVEPRFKEYILLGETSPN